MKRFDVPITSVDKVKQTKIRIGVVAEAVSYSE